MTNITPGNKQEGIIKFNELNIDRMAKILTTVTDDMFIEKLTGERIDTEIVHTLHIRGPLLVLVETFKDASDGIIETIEDRSASYNEEHNAHGVNKMSIYADYPYYTHTANIDSVGSKVYECSNPVIMDIIIPSHRNTDLINVLNKASGIIKKPELMSNTMGMFVYRVNNASNELMENIIDCVPGSICVYKTNDNDAYKTNIDDDILLDNLISSYKRIISYDDDLNSKTFAYLSSVLIKTDPNYYSIINKVIEIRKRISITNDHEYMIMHIEKDALLRIIDLIDENLPKEAYKVVDLSTGNTLYGKMQ